MANAYESRKRFKYLFLLTAIIIATASVWIANTLVNELKEEERKKIEIWAEAFSLLSKLSSDDVNPALFDEYNELLLKIAQENTTIPVIILTDEGDVLDFRNIKIGENEDPSILSKKISKFSRFQEPITIRADEDTIYRVYYDDSTVLKQLRIFPFIQLIVLFIFIAVSFLALNSTQKAEQNKVWVGLSKETAHQLGTPISSLMAWTEYLKTKDMDPQLLDEMDKDVQRLKIIAERFSKIGSSPEPEPMDLYQSVQNAVNYMGRRISSKVKISIEIPDDHTTIMMNDSLFGWTLENLIKNAVDAMNGQGEITITSRTKDTKVLLDISDTGKGISKNKFETIFHPGYTTKERGWGLGLSLVRRIIENYSKGKIYVYKSELGKGTTFRIELKKFIIHNL
jgi:Signal transduction histidine kinase